MTDTAPSITPTAPTTKAPATTTETAHATPATLSATVSATVPATAAPAPATVPITQLVHPKTITITFVPDWTQEDMDSRTRAVTVSVVLGPAGTLPQHSLFCFEFDLYSEKAYSPTSGSGNLHRAFAIPNGDRALLWHVNAPYARFEHAVHRPGCRLSSGDELKTVSVALRTHADEKHPNALVYVRRDPVAPKSEHNSGYLKVVHRHHYYLNLTFATSSTIAQLVGLYSWRPIMYLTVRRFNPVTGRDEVIQSRVFTHFNTNWAQGVEHNPSEGEQKAAVEALVADQKEQVLRDEAKQKQQKQQALAAQQQQPRQHEVLRAQHQQQQAQLLTQYQQQYRNQYRSLQQYQQRQADQIGLELQTVARQQLPPPPPPQQQQLKDPKDEKKTQTYQHAMGPIGHVTVGGPVVVHAGPISGPVVTTFAELEHELKTKPLHSILLPVLDEKTYPFPSLSELAFNASAPTFSQASTLSKALSAVEFRARLVSLDNKSESSDAARHMLSVLSAVSQMLGWQHVQIYMTDAKNYLEKTKEISAATVYQPSGVVSGSMEDYRNRGHILLQRLAQRIEWVLLLQRHANKPFDPLLLVQTIAADRAWVCDSNLWMREAESKVTELLVANQGAFHEFCDVQRKGVAWPHSTELRKQIESAGWVYRPMMIKRDRCICNTCGVEVCGWRPYCNPWTYHDYSKHEPTFRPPTNWATSADPVAVCQAITEANLRGRVRESNIACAPAIAAPAPVSGSQTTVSPSNNCLC